MKNLTEQQYANGLVEQHYNEVHPEDDSYGMSYKMAIQCAKKDVQNTIDALDAIDTNLIFAIHLLPLVIYYNKVLTILNDMK